MARLTDGWNVTPQTTWVEPHSQVWKRARQVPMLPSSTEKINAPDPMPEMPKFSVVSILIPILSLALMGGLYAIFFKGRAGYLLLMIPTTLLSVGGTVGKYFASKKKFYTRLNARKEDYKNYLSWQCDHLDGLLDRQIQVLSQINPSVQEWHQRIASISSQVWERSLMDPDFLHVRVGLGKTPASFKVIPPTDNSGADPLIDTAVVISRDYTSVEAPVTVNLQSSSLAIVGNYYERENALRALLIQLTAAHSPEDVRLAVICSGDSIQEWNWARWLPHIWTQDHIRRLIAEDPGKAETAVERVLTELKTSSTTHWFIAIPEPQMMAEKFMGQIVSELQKPDSRLHLLTTVSSPQLAPSVCRTILVLGNHGKSSMWLIGPPRQEIALIADYAYQYEVERIARTMAPLKVVSTGTGDIPNTVPLFDVLGGKYFSKDTVLDQWQAASLKDLVVPIGIKAGGKVMQLDLHETGHGPHGLIAGTTGSGKSELIQTLIISLAAHFPPDQLAFMLIDYKGGGTGQVFANLPHLAGTISNLDESLAKRALVALHTEVEKRQLIFNSHQIIHIDEYLKLYREGKASDVLPRLVIIVDEFAELAKNMTDFLPELVSIARVGRSLGVHLILATQKPAGVVNDQIWSNARFKLCLKVQDVGDSKEMLKKPDAAYLTQPGRAYLMVGHDELYELFQSGYGGAIVQNEMDEFTTQVYRVDLDGTKIKLNTPKITHQVVDDAKTQISAAVRMIAAAFGESDYPAPPELWVAPLPKRLALDELPESAFEKIVIGLMDDPVAVKQSPLVIDLNQGHLQIIGAPGTGKSMTLHTFLLSLAKIMTPKQASVYILDLDKRQSKILEDLPNVGAVIMSYEEERMNRLFLNLLSMVNERRELSPAELEKKPWVILAIDNFPALLELSEVMQNTVMQLSREAGGLKMMLILTATTALSYRISSNFSQAIVLNMIDPNEYSMIAGPNPPRPAQLSGRGLIRAPRPMEIQIAKPAAGENPSQIYQQMEHTVAGINASWRGKQAMQIPAKPDIVFWEDLKTATSRVSLGIHRVTLRNFQIPLRERDYMVVTGTSGGGKTNFLLNIAVGLGRIFSPDQMALYIGSPESRGLYLAGYLPQVVAYAETLKDTQTLLEYVRAHLQNPDGRRVVLVLDQFDLIFRSGFSKTLIDVIGYGQEYGMTAICAGPSQAMAGGERILRLLREQNAIWLGEVDPLDAGTFGLQKQRSGGKGKGYINLSGRVAPILTAIIQKPEAVIKTIQAKYPQKVQIPQGEKI